MSSPDGLQVSDFPATGNVANTDIFYSQNVNTGFEQKTTATQLQSYVLAPIANSTITGLNSIDGTETIPVGKTGLFQTTLAKVGKYALNPIAAATNSVALALTGAEVFPLSQSGSLVQATLSTIVQYVLGSLSPQRLSCAVLIAGQATYVTSGYTVGLINVYVGGVRLNPSQYQALDGINVVITDANILAYLVPGMTVDIDASLSVVASDLATVGMIEALYPTNQPAVSALTGAEVMTVSQGSVLFQSPLTKIASWLINTYQGFTSTATGATARTLQSKLQDSVNLADFAGYDATGATDSTAAVLAAAASLGTQGGTIRFKGILNISTNLTLPEAVALVGYCETVGGRKDDAYNSTNYPSIIVIDPSVSIIQSNRSMVAHCLVISKPVSQFGAYPLPWASIPVATAAIATFAGTAFKPTSNTADNRLEEVLIIGFQYAYYGVGTLSNARPVFKRVLGDCTNGIFVSAVYDVGLAENCEFWPFTTTNVTALVSDALLMRSGTAYYTENGATWFEWHNCTQYGYAIGHDVNGVRNVRQNQCGSDAPGTSTAIGFQYRGAVNNCINIGATIAGQGNAGIVVNTTADGNSTSINVIGANFHGSTSANGYVSVLAGNLSMASCHFDGNALYGHVNLQNAASLLTMADCTHAGAGSSVPIYGNATAVALAQISNPRNIGSFSNTVWGQLANFAVKIAVAGSAILGIDGLAGNYRTLRYRSSGGDRWWVGADNSAEAGSNAGSAYVIQRYDDTGAYIDTPLTVNRANGTVSIGSGGLAVANTVAVTVATGSGVLGIDRPSASYGVVRYRTTGVDRWWAGTNVTAEAGSNAGSDYAILRYSDTGVYLGTPLTIVRSSGVILMGSATALASAEQLQVTGAARITTYVAAQGGFRVTEGSNTKQGVATLAAGTVTVSNTSITANSRVFLTAQDNNSTGSLRVSARTAGTSFTITSSNSADSGVVAYEIFEPA